MICSEHVKKIWAMIAYVPPASERLSKQKLHIAKNFKTNHDTEDMNDVRACWIFRLAT